MTEKEKEEVLKSDNETSNEVKQTIDPKAKESGPIGGGGSLPDPSNG